MLSAVLRRCGGADRQKVGTSIGKWLSGSRDRNGKRLQRLRNTPGASAADDSTAAEPSQSPADPPAPQAPSREQAVMPQQLEDEEREAARLGFAMVQEEELPLNMY